MKDRETRRQVLIKARIRIPTGWDDVWILNASNRGLLVEAADPPARGAYVEVRRGDQTVVARVVWRAGTRFGACTQDPLNIEALIREPNSAQEDSPSGLDSTPERRAAPRAPSATERQERSRRVGKAFEFVCLASFGIAGAAFMAECLRRTLAAPLAAVSVAMDGR